VQPGAYPTEISGKTIEADDAARTASYGATAQRLGAAMNAFAGAAEGRDPADIARAIVRLANVPAGMRPLRTILPSDDGVETLNAAAGSVQAAMLQALGIDDLLPKAAAV